jgi:GTPase SAR1 family protein
VIHTRTGQEITLNGWDFGGQRVYRPTHQLFFSSPAIYLVVWKPREGPQQGFVKEWLKLIKHREPDAKILVVATHGGPQQRQPDIDRQEIWDLFGKETVVELFLRG